MRIPCLCLLLVLGWPLPSAAGVVRGRLTTPPAQPAAHRLPEAYPGRAQAMPAATAPELGQVEDAVVHLERPPAGADSSAPTLVERPRLLQRNQAFEPRVLAVVAGTRVEFPNLDPIYHNVFSLSPAKRFDLGKYARGGSRGVTFDRPGLVQVFCDIHSNMAAWILVVPHRAFARPDSAGRWALPELPPGEYTVKAWHPDLGEVSRQVRVPAEGAVDLELGW